MRGVVRVRRPLTPLLPSACVYSVLGPPTQDALRPSGTLRENHMLQTERRKKKKAAGSTAGSVRSDGTPKRTKSGRRIPTVRARLARVWCQSLSVG
jgi:hypothetical protein